jgi:hypothetical protein
MMTNPTEGRHAQAARSRAADARERAAKDIAAAEQCDAAEALLPAGIVADKVSQYAAYATVAVDITAHDRAEALDFFETFDVLPLARVHDGCLSFKPAARITERQREHADILEGDDLWPLVWRYDPSPYQRGASLEWYATLGDDVTAKVRCRITNDPARVESHHQHAGKTTRSRVVRYRWQLRDGPNGVLDRFASGSYDRCGEYVAYFHVEPNNGPLPSDYLQTRDADCECSTHWHERRPVCERCVVLVAERAMARHDRAEAAAKVCDARYCDRPKPCPLHGNA